MKREGPDAIGFLANLRRGNFQAGFAGGAKYFFPGVAGPELTHMTHWLGALATIERVIGRVDTPTRRVIEAAGILEEVP